MKDKDTGNFRGYPDRIDIVIDRGKCHWVRRQIFHLDEDGIQPNEDRIRARAWIETRVGSKTDWPMTILKGSQASRHFQCSSIEKSEGIREQLLGSGVLKETSKCYEFTEDFTFRSCSAATMVILGSSHNWRYQWKDHKGRSFER